MVSSKNLTRSRIEAALREAKGVRATAAHLLGISPRTFVRHLREIEEIEGVDPWRDDPAKIVRAYERQIALRGVTKKNTFALQLVLTEAMVEPSWLQAFNFQTSDRAVTDEQAD